MRTSSPVRSTLVALVCCCVLATFAATGASAVPAGGKSRGSRLGARNSAPTPAAAQVQFVPLRELGQRLGILVVFELPTSTTVLTTSWEPMRVVYLRMGSKEVRIQLYEQPMREITEKLSASPFESGGVAYVPVQFLSAVLGLEANLDEKAHRVSIRHPKSGQMLEINSVTAGLGKAVPARSAAPSPARPRKAGPPASGKRAAVQPLTQRPRDGRWAGTKVPTGRAAAFLPTVSINFVVDRQGTVVRDVWGSIQLASWGMTGMGMGAATRGGPFSIPEEVPIKQVSFGNPRGPVNGYFLSSQSASGAVICVDSGGMISGSWEAKWVGPLPTPPSPQPALTPEVPKVQGSSAVQAARKLGTETDKPVVTTASGLQYIDVKVGSGDVAQPGEMVTVNYTGWLEDGTKFDSSFNPGRQPFSFSLGAGQVIRGWDEGVAGMKPGGVRKLILPSDLGYGPQGSPPVIPRNATLIFEVIYLGKS